MINQNWVFGKNAGLDFSTDPPTANKGYLISTNEGCSSISDANGQLLFYTDGIRIWKADNTLVTAALQGHDSSTQSSIIVPAPGTTQQYYIFTANGSTATNLPFDGVLLDTNTWATTPISQLVSLPTNNNMSPTEKVTVIRHANQTDFWVMTIVQMAGNNASLGPGYLRLFKVDTNGLSYVGQTDLLEDVQDAGYLKASYDGKRIAIANSLNKNVLLYDFDNSSGALNTANRQVIDVPTNTISNTHAKLVYGVEFSPNHNVLYYTVVGSRQLTGLDGRSYLFQVDLTATSLSSTEVLTFDTTDKGYGMAALQLAQDGRIYIAIDVHKQVGAILMPDVIGLGCNPADNFVQLDPDSTCLLGLPNILPVDIVPEPEPDPVPDPTPEPHKNDCCCCPPAATMCCPAPEAPTTFDVIISRVRIAENSARDGKGEFMLTGYADGKSALVPGMGSTMSLFSNWGWRVLNKFIVNVPVKKGEKVSVPLMAEALLNASSGMRMGAAQELKFIVLEIGKQSEPQVLRIECLSARSNRPTSEFFVLEIEFTAYQR